VLDRLSKEVRSRVMSRIRGKNTQPELRVRTFLHAAGFRYRLHDMRLPGRPDIVLPARRTCVFVHGCFWHGCRKCADGRRKVLSNLSYWGPKIRRNRKRDGENSRALRRSGWCVFEIWECDTENRMELRKLLRSIRNCGSSARKR
jgi:DNA mismatch endonuclease, patch repair protein